MYKSGTGTRGRGHRDACGDAGRGTRDEGLEEKVGGKLCDISVLFMVNIRFHLPKPHWTPYDAYTKYFFIILNLFGIECCYILGDPGADSGGKGKSKRAEK